MLTQDNWWAQWSRPGIISYSEFYLNISPSGEPSHQQLAVGNVQNFGARNRIFLW